MRSESMHSSMAMSPESCTCRPRVPAPTLHVHADRPQSAFHARRTWRSDSTQRSRSSRVGRTAVLVWWKLLLSCTVFIVSPFLLCPQAGGRPAESPLPSTPQVYRLLHLRSRPVSRDQANYFSGLTETVGASIVAAWEKIPKSAENAAGRLPGADIPSDQSACRTWNMLPGKSTPRAYR